MFSKVESVEMECWQRPLLREQVEVHQGGVPTTDAYFDLAVPGGAHRDFSTFHGCSPTLTVARPRGFFAEQV